MIKRHTLKVWIHSHLKLIFGLGLLAFVLFDWTIVDRWHVHGRVVEAGTGAGVPDTWVLANFYGATPLVNLPIPPHPNHRHDVCMGTAITKTDLQGNYALDVIAFNRALARKNVFVMLFKPGWQQKIENQEGVSGDINSSLVTPSRRMDLAMVKANRERVGHRQITTDYLLVLPAQEHTHTQELFEVTNIVDHENCSAAGLSLSKEAMIYALQIAETYEERDLVRSSCRLANKHIAKMNQRRLQKGNWYLRLEPETTWPFDCDHLDFKRQPSALVLEAEAKDRADIQRRQQSRNARS